MAFLCAARHAAHYRAAAAHAAPFDEVTHVFIGRGDAKEEAVEQSGPRCRHKRLEQASPFGPPVQLQREGAVGVLLAGTQQHGQPARIGRACARRLAQQRKTLVPLVRRVARLGDGR